MDDNNDGQKDSSGKTKSRLYPILLAGLVGGVLLAVYLSWRNSYFSASVFTGWDFLWNIFLQALLNIALWISILWIFSSIRSYFGAKAGNNFWLVFIQNFTVILIAGFLGASFQVMYASFIETDFLTIIVENAQARLEEMGTNPEKIQQILNRKITLGQLFQDTLFYFLFLGIFVCLMVTAFIYKKKSYQTK